VRARLRESFIGDRLLTADIQICVIVRVYSGCASECMSRPVIERSTPEKLCKNEIYGREMVNKIAFLDDVSSLQYVIDNCFRKIFNAKSKDTVHECEIDREVASERRYMY